MKQRLLFAFSLVCVLFSDPRAQSVLRPGDRIVLVGGALAERMQHHGWLETELRLALPNHRLSVRNLGFSGDEIDVAQRTRGFGTPTEWLERAEADLVLACFGFNESFAGDKGLGEFRTELAAWIRRTRGVEPLEGEHRSHADSPSALKREPRRIVLLSPLPHEPAFLHLLERPIERQRMLQAYSLVMRDVAREHEVPFIDLMEPMRTAYAVAANEGTTLTLNGTHLNGAGNAELARVVRGALVPEGTRAEPLEMVESVRAVVLEKNRLWFNRYRATDGYNVYGGRSSLAYENDQTNFEVLQRELAILDAQCANLDRALDQRTSSLASTGPSSESVELPAPEAPVPDRLVVPTNRPGEGPGGAHRFTAGAAAIEAMQPAEGFEVELFADEALFPELANPVQMAFDAGGRLWVACWPTYPHWAPGEPMHDKLVVFHDDDADGHADRTTVFADDLHNPTGFAFWKGGVIVANCPDLLFLEDVDGDGVADRRERLLHGLSSADTHHAANSFTWGPEGALYFQEGTFHRSQIETIHGPLRNDGGCVWRFDPRGWRVERYVPYGFANPHGHVFDAFGQDFVTDGTGNVNYYALPFSGHLESPARHRGYFPFFRQRSRPAAGTAILSSAHFPPANQGNYLIANVIGFQGIFQYAIEDDGSGFRAEEVEPLVFSSDPNFRPVALSVGPDGAVWFLDWQNPLIGHMQHHLRDPSRDRSHGRIYRVVARERALLEVEDYTDWSASRLVARLLDADLPQRERLRSVLDRRDPDRVSQAWRALFDSSATETLEPSQLEQVRLERLWSDLRHGRLAKDRLERLLTAEDFRVRAAAVRVVRNARRRLEDPLRYLERAVRDPHPRVRLEAVVAASFFSDLRACAFALEVLERPTDRFLDYALEETLVALEPVWRAALLHDGQAVSESSAGLEHLLARLTTEELARTRACEDRDRALVGRADTEQELRWQALEALARGRGEPVAKVLLEAIVDADTSAGDVADQRLGALFPLSERLAEEERAAWKAGVSRMMEEGTRAATRRLAAASSPAFAEGLLTALEADSTQPDALLLLLEAVPFLPAPLSAPTDSTRQSDEPLFEALLRFVEASGGFAEASEEAGVRGVRYVRIELPGAERTLSLAEVEVFSGRTNVAPEGTARQSSENWGGVPERALDGNTSGAFGDGGQTHTMEDQPHPWWELDLGREVPVDAVRVWNRTDGAYGRRLDGFVVTFAALANGARREVHRYAHGEALEAVVDIRLASDADRIVAAACEALAALAQRASDPEKSARAFRCLAAGVLDSGSPTAHADALLRLLPSVCPEQEARQLALDLAARFEEKTLQTAVPRLLDLARVLETCVEERSAEVLAAASRRLRPHTLRLRPVRDAMRFDREHLQVVAGHPVELTFENVDLMPHNVLVTAPGALASVGRAAEGMAADEDAWERSFVPDLPEVLVAGSLLQPGEAETLRFEAPRAPGVYPFVCTFPGHWVRMNGTLEVVRDWDAWSAGDPAMSSQGSQPTGQEDWAGRFVRNWSVDDIDLATLASGSVPRGRRVFEEASCVRCHVAQAGDEGQSGPSLAERMARATPPSPAELLSSILEPSRTVDPAYATWLFETKVDLVAGILVEEDEETYWIRDDPYRSDLLGLPKEEVIERTPSAISTMPEGLLSTFQADEIRDLLSYLLSLAPEESAASGAESKASPSTSAGERPRR